MSVQGIGSYAAFAVWQSSMQYSSTQGAAQTGGASCNNTGGTDSATISQQGFAMLVSMQSGSSGQPQLTDDKAAKIGAKIQARDPDLFKKIDANGDGQLSADELKAGKDQIKAARAAEIGSKIQEANPALFKALDTNGDGTLGADELQAVRSQLNGDSGGTGNGAGSNAVAGAGNGTGSSGVHHHHHHGGGDGGTGGGQSQDLASLLAAQGQSSGSGSASDLQTSGTGSDQASSPNGLQLNNMNDVLQNLLSIMSKQSS